MGITQLVKLNFLKSQWQWRWISLKLLPLVLIKSSDNSMKSTEKLSLLCDWARQQIWCRCATTNLSLFTSTASSTEHEELPGGLCRRCGNRRCDAVTCCGPDVRRMITVAVPSVGGSAGMCEIMTGRIGTQPNGRCRVIQSTLDVRQTCCRTLPHAGLVSNTSRNCTQYQQTPLSVDKNLQNGYSSENQHSYSIHQNMPLFCLQQLQRHADTKVSFYFSFTPQLLYGTPSTWNVQQGFDSQ